MGMDRDRDEVREVGMGVGTVPSSILPLPSLVSIICMYSNESQFGTLHLLGKMLKKIF